MFYFWLSLNFSSAEKLEREVALLVFSLNPVFNNMKNDVFYEMNVNYETINVIFIILFIFCVVFNLSCLNMIPKFKTIEIKRFYNSIVE